MLEKKLFGVISLGCDKNRVDTEKLLGLLKEKGCRTTDELAKAQIVIVNTCAFLETAREEAIKTVLECADYKSGNLEKIVVTGCLPQKFIGELFKPLDEADVFLGINDYEKIFEALEASYAELSEKIMKIENDRNRNLDLIIIENKLDLILHHLGLNKSDSSEAPEIGDIIVRPDFSQIKNEINSLKDMFEHN